MTQPTAAYKRVLLKVSGEALMGRREYGLDNETVGASPPISATSWRWASRSAW